MEIQLLNIGKRFGSKWLFRNLDVHINENSTLAITGSNGTGKSTLIQILFQYIVPSSGSLVYRVNGSPVSAEDVPRMASFVSPYQDVPELLTMREVVKLHFTFKEKMAGFDQAVEALNLQEALDKPVKFFSSGMKQRLKLLLALYSQSHLLLLDEPCANLDEQGVKWYCDTIQELVENRICVVASNQPYEYNFCSQHIDIHAYQR